MAAKYFVMTKERESDFLYFQWCCAPKQNIYLGSFHFLSAPPLKMAGFRPLKVLAAPFEEKIRRVHFLVEPLKKISEAFIFWRLLWFKNPTPLVQKFAILRGGSDKKWNVPLGGSALLYRTRGRDLDCCFSGFFLCSLSTCVLFLSLWTVAQGQNRLRRH